MGYNEDHPVIAFRLEKEIKEQLLKIAKDKKIALNKLLHDFIISAMQKEGILKVKYEFTDN